MARRRLILDWLEARILLSAMNVPADCNGDGVVNSSDAAIVMAHYGQSSGMSPATGDFNLDGMVNALDFNMLATQYGQTIQFSAPIVITSGGTYSGNWFSNTHSIPAVRVETTQPVVIQDSIIRGLGDLIDSEVDHTNLTIRNCVGYGVNPNIAGKSAGKFADIEEFDSADIENNYMQGTAGILFDTFSGNKTAALTVKVDGNVATNIDGRRSDGNGGYLTYNTRTNKTTGKSDDGFDIDQFVQLANAQSVANVEIAWNQVINMPGLSRVEDNVSIYLSSGTSASPIRIHDNYIDGAYTINPTQQNTSDSQYTYDWSYSGGGIMLSDGSSTTLAGACGFVQAYNNEVLDTTNYGMAITAGHDDSIYNNRILSAGVLSNGQAIVDQNVGAAIWDGYGNAKYNTFFNNGGYGNVIGWVYNSTTRNDWWMPNSTTWVNTNVRMANPITFSTEQAEWLIWRGKLVSAAMVIGPLGP